MNIAILSPAVRSAQFLAGDLIFRRITPPSNAQQAGVQLPMPPKCEDPKCTLCNNR